MEHILLSMETMTLDDLVAIARPGAGVQLTEESDKRIVKTRELIEQWVSEEKTIKIWLDTSSTHRSPRKG